MKKLFILFLTFTSLASFADEINLVGNFKFTSGMKECPVYFLIDSPKTNTWHMMGVMGHANYFEEIISLDEIIHDEAEDFTIKTFSELKNGILISKVYRNDLEVDQLLQTRNMSVTQNEIGRILKFEFIIQDDISTCEYIEDIKIN